MCFRFNQWDLEIRDTWRRKHYFWIELAFETELAISRNSLDISRLLFQYGKEKATDRQFRDGSTLLHRIAQGKAVLCSDNWDEFQQDDALNLLSEFNANPTIRQYDGNVTPYQLAKFKKNHTIAEKIRKYQEEKYHGGIKPQDTIREQNRQIDQAHHATPAAQATNNKFVISGETLELEEEIGEGANGVVYRVLWNGREVAVKRLKGADCEDTIAAFKRETKIFEQLRNPNIVQMFGVCDQPNNYAIVMEYLSQGSLNHLLTEVKKSGTTLDWEKIGFKIAYGVCCGLLYLHTQKVVHADIKSHNVFIDGNNTAKIGDFGLTRYRPREAAHSSTYSFAGTIGWMAPELIKEESPTSRSDMYIVTRYYSGKWQA